MPDLTLAIIGAYDPDYEPHVATVDALHHAAARERRVLATRWLSPEALDPAESALRGVDGVVLAPAPPRTQIRHIDDILAAIRCCRRSGLPMLGTGRGFLYTLLEVARHLAGLREAHSTEFIDNPKTPVVTELPDPIAFRERSGRYGTMSVRPAPDTLLARLYGTTDPVGEPHRAVYGLNPDYSGDLRSAGLVFSATDADGGIVRAIEMSGHPFFVAVSFIPQVRSTWAEPHPLFLGLVAAARDARARSAPGHDGSPAPPAPPED